MKKELLIIEAHSDDSAIGAAGFLEKFKDEYEFHFLLMTVSDIEMTHCGPLSREQRLQEYANYVGYFDGQWHQDLNVPINADARLDTIPKREIVGYIENFLNQIKPEVIIVQGPSFHHDHTIVYESTIAATRPTARHCPNEIYIMENPTYIHSLGPATDFRPDFYIALTKDQMQKKLDLFSQNFPSQIREESNYLSPEGIRSWSRYRGIECRQQYAEAFKTFQRVV